MFSELTKSSKRAIAAGAPPAYFKDGSTNPEEWREFVEYVRRDVEAMRTADKELKRYRVTPDREVWLLDQRINARGFPTDPVYIENVIRLVAEQDQITRAKLIEATGLQNPNSDKQIRQWLEYQRYPIDTASVRSGRTDSKANDTLRFSTLRFSTPDKSL